MHLISQDKLKLETLLDIEKDKNNNLNKHIDNIKIKNESSIKDI